MNTLKLIASTNVINNTGVDDFVNSKVLSLLDGMVVIMSIKSVMMGTDAHIKRGVT